MEQMGVFNSLEGTSLILIPSICSFFALETEDFLCRVQLCASGAVCAPRWQVLKLLRQNRRKQEHCRVDEEETFWHATKQKS